MGEISVKIYPIEPHTKPRMTRSDKWKQRKCVMEYRAFKDECRLLRVEIPPSCKIVFKIPMPASWSKKKKSAMVGQAHTQTPDIDNLLKGIFDAVFEDDAHIWNVWAVKLWAVTGSIEISPSN